MPPEEFAILTRDDHAMSVSATAEALALKEAALANSALVGRVTNASEQERAVAAQMEIKRVLKAAEDARKAIKEPVLDYGRRIDRAAEEFKSELSEELLRVTKLVGDFQALELARARAEEAARRASLEALERQRQAEISQAPSHDKIEEVNARYNSQAAEVPPLKTPVRTKGQTVSEDWEIEVTDIWALARAHSMCVKIEPRLSEIKQLLDLGVKVAGVRAEKRVKAGVRLDRERKALEVVA